jgi:hypothetical protein
MYLCALRGTNPESEEVGSLTLCHTGLNYGCIDKCPRTLSKKNSIIQHIFGQIVGLIK